MSAYENHSKRSKPHPDIDLLYISYHSMGLTCTKIKTKSKLVFLEAVVCCQDMTLLSELGVEHFE